MLVQRSKTLHRIIDEVIHEVFPLAIDTATDEGVSFYLLPEFCFSFLFLNRAGYPVGENLYHNKRMRRPNSRMDSVRLKPVSMICLTTSARD
jgi:hypothetical protein